MVSNFMREENYFLTKYIPLLFVENMLLLCNIEICTEFHLFLFITEQCKGLDQSYHCYTWDTNTTMNPITYVKHNLQGEIIVLLLSQVF